MSNTPKIRFDGFRGEWESEKFSSVFTTIKNNTLSRAELNDEEGRAKNIHYGDILVRFGEYLDVKQENIPFITSDELAEKLSAFALQDGDVIIADTAEDSTVGKCTEIGNIEADMPVVSGLHTIPVRPNADFASGYLGYFMNSDVYHDQLLPLMQGTKVSSIAKTYLGKTDIHFPQDTSEQEKIASFLNYLNDLIVAQQQKYEKLLALKSACLEKMFPKEGCKVPEMRCKGFTGDWEQRKVGDIADRYDNLRNPVAANLRVPGITPYYGANGIQDYVEGFTHEGEYVLVAEDGANDLKNYPVRCVSGRIWVNNHAHVLQGKSKMMANPFLAYSINQADIESLLVGGGRAKLNAEILMDIDLLVPSYAEQHQMGLYFTHLDNLITLHQRKLEKLKQFKQAMLNDMFV